MVIETIANLPLAVENNYPSTLYHVNGQMIFINYEHEIVLYPLTNEFIKQHIDSVNALMRKHNFPIRYLYRRDKSFIEIRFKYGINNLLVGGKWIINKLSLKMDVE